MVPDVGSGRYFLLDHEDLALELNVGIKASVWDVLESYICR